MNRVRFGDLLSEPVRNGVYKKKEFHGRGTKIVNMKELFAYDFISDQPDSLVELTPAELAKSQLRSGDLLFARRSFVLEGAGKCSLVTDPTEALTFESSMIRARPDPAVAHSRFLYYFFKSPPGRARMASIAARTAVSGITGTNLTGLELDLPDVNTQRQAASVLQLFDDLIENNRRRVELLEEMARAIYREWFVKFRYPGHEDVPMVDSALGAIPEGWRLSTCGDELNFIGGGTPSKKQPSYWNEGSVPWYTPTDLTKTGWRYAAPPGLRITESGVAKSSARLFPAGSVLMTSRATLGVLAIATTEATTNQGFIVILPDVRWSSGFIYEWLDSKAAELAALGTGATFKEITKGSFKRFPFVVPAQSVLDAYQAATGPLEEDIHVLERQTRRLSDIRDRLLPKLVTGQIDVSTLDLDAVVRASEVAELAVA